MTGARPRGSRFTFAREGRSGLLPRRTRRHRAGTSQLVEHIGRRSLAVHGRHHPTAAPLLRRSSNIPSTQLSGLDILVDDTWLSGVPPSRDSSRSHAGGSTSSSTGTSSRCSIFCQAGVPQVPPSRRSSTQASVPTAQGATTAAARLGPQGRRSHLHRGPRAGARRGHPRRRRRPRPDRTPLHHHEPGRREERRVRRQHPARVPGRRPASRRLTFSSPPRHHRSSAASTSARQAVGHYIRFYRLPVGSSGSRRLLIQGRGPAPAWTSAWDLAAALASQPHGWRRWGATTDGRRACDLPRRGHPGGNIAHAAVREREANLHDAARRHDQ